MKICAIIAARGGSKGVPHKNIRLLLGKPLITYTIEQALNCKLIDKVVVSTDSEEIAAIARSSKAEVPFLRPKELATDFSGKLDVLKHAVKILHRNSYEPDFIVDLDPTSPLRSDYDIQECIKLAQEKKCSVVITGCLAKKNPYFNMVEVDASGKANLCKKDLGKIIRRQDAPKVYEMNASIYVYKTASLLSANSIWDLDAYFYEMPPERSVDIDREIDFKIVELYMSEVKNGL